MRAKPTVLCVAPFHNPHIVGVYNCLARRDDLAVTRVSLRPLNQARLDLGWGEMPADAPYLQPWRRGGDWLKYLRRLWTADMVVFPGFQHIPSLPLHHWLRRLSGKGAMLWSEAFLGHHRRPWWRYALGAALRVPVDTPRWHLLAIGGEPAAEDYHATGARRWQCWRFAFATEGEASAAGAPPSRREGPVELLYSGALIERKRVDLLLAALGRPALRQAAWRLTVLGDGPLRDDLESQARALGLEAKVRFLGALPRTQCHTVYTDADVLILPSRFDGWGAVVNEALEHGLAVICSDAVGAGMLVREGQCGAVFPAGSEDELAASLADLIDDRGLLLACRRRSREQFERYRPAEVARRLAGLIRGVTGAAAMPDYGDGLLGPIVPRRIDRQTLLRRRLGD